jgi:hypothetical protein
VIGSQFVVAVPCAVAGAASFGLASAIQFRATKEVPLSTTLNPQLLVNLVRKPIWLASVVTVVLGLSLQVVALAFGPLVLVQPLLVTSVLFGGMFTAGMAGHRLDRIVLLGGLACAGGLSAFLLLAQPSGQAGEFNQRHIFPLALILVVVILGALLLGSWSHGELRVISLAVATGVFYGVTAGLIKAVAAQIRVDGITTPFLHWHIYMVCVIGPMGFLLSQNTFQSGKLISPALAVITTVDPLVGIAIGVQWLGESLTATTVALVGETISAAAIIAGIAVLTHRSEHLRSLAESTEQETTWG